MATTEGERLMNIFKSVKSLFRYHETTRLLIAIQEERITAQSMRIWRLEERLEKLEAK
jgi:hypothetical protein